MTADKKCLAVKCLRFIDPKFIQILYSLSSVFTNFDAESCVETKDTFDRCKLVIQYNDKITHIFDITACAKNVYGKHM